MHPTETVQKWYATMDVEGLLSDDIRWEIAQGFPEAGDYVGKAEVGAMFSRLVTNFSGFSADVAEQFASEDGARVVALGAYRGTAVATGRAFEVPFCHVWEVRGDRISAVRHYPNTGLMQAALT